MGRQGKDVLSCVTMGEEVGSGRFCGEVVRFEVTLLDAATRTDELVRTGAVAAVKLPTVSKQSRNS